MIIRQSLDSIKTYEELIRIPTFKERIEYLKLNGHVGEDTFGDKRYLNQIFYQTDPEWKEVRRKVIIRDNGHDLAMMDDKFEIRGRIIVHHMNPITSEDIINRTDKLLNPNYLVCVSELTDRAIHFGDNYLLECLTRTERKPNDLCPWKV